MKWFNIFRDRLRALRRRETVLEDIDREMRLHLELQVEANIKAGMSPAEAREQAMRSFGNINHAVDAAYDVKVADYSKRCRRTFATACACSPNTKRLRQSQW